jgi:hypothetical protein
VASGDDSTAIGYNANASYSFSMALGSGATASAANQIVLGTANETVKIPGKVNSLNFAAPPTIASGASIAIGAAASNYIYISGTSNISGGDTIAAGAMRWLHFTGSCALLYNATSWILSTGATIYPVNGDVACFVSLGSGNWQMIGYQRLTGQPLAGGVTSGTYTPTLAYATPGTAWTYGTQTGRWIKDSSGMYTVTALVSVSNDPTGSGNLYFSLPSSAATGEIGIACTVYGVNFGAANQIMGFVYGGTVNGCYFYKMAADGSGGSLITDADIGAGTKSFTINGSYLA